MLSESKLMKQMLWYFNIWRLTSRRNIEFIVLRRYLAEDFILTVIQGTILVYFESAFMIENHRQISPPH